MRENRRETIRPSLYYSKINLIQCGYQLLSDFSLAHRHRKPSAALQRRKDGYNFGPGRKSEKGVYSFGSV